MSFRNTGRMRGRNVEAVIDIGSSKIVCLIFVDETGAPSISVDGKAFSGVRILGMGHQRARGIKAGVVADIEVAEQAVRMAVSQAERTAGVEIDRAYVSVSCGRLKSTNFVARAKTQTGVVDATDLARLMDAGRAFAERDGRSLVHLSRVGMRLDGLDAGGEPIGMAAQELAADLHTISADETPLRNLVMLIERCYLDVAGLIVTPFASALAVTTPQERQLGCTVIDLGGGTATLALYIDGRFVFADAVPVGGLHLTYDIARTLQTPLEEAERIKTLYGTLTGAQSDEHEFFSYSSTEDDEGGPYQASKAQLAEILRPRVSSVLGLVRERLQQSGLAEFGNRRIVLTGAASQLTGLSEFAANELQCPVRVAQPIALTGMPSSVANPAYATLLGMIAALGLGQGAVITYRERDALSQGYVGRVGQWLKEGF